MNYGKKKTAERQDNISSKSNMRKKRIGVRFFKGLLICLLVMLVVIGGGGGLFLKSILDNTPDVSPAMVQPKGYSTTVLAQDGTEIERFVSEGANRIYRTIDEIPVDMQHAFVAIEDERFYQHNGIDIAGIGRAFVVGITNGHFSEGASTITQQLIKNNVFTQFMEEKTFSDKLERKVQEQYLAIEIEKQLDKNTILELYMNTVNLGQNSLGVQSAAKRYFNKDVLELTLSEITVIAGITQSPTKYNPVTNPEANAKRRTKVLGDMLTQEYITQAAHDEALADPVYDRIQNINSELLQDTSPYTYFVDALSKSLQDDLKEKGYSPAQAYNLVYSGGLTVYSTQDLGIQAICDDEFQKPSNYPSRTEVGVDYALTITRADGTQENFSTENLKSYLKNARGGKYPLVFANNEQAVAAVEEFKSTLLVEGDAIVEKLSLSPQPQASVVIMEQKSGQIKALVGGRGAKEDSLSLNRATDSDRQPGSCFKILAAYAPALDIGAMSLATSLVDEPYNYSTGRPVKNWYSGYRGSVTVRTAIKDSMNIIAVKAITEITPQVAFDYLKNFGLTTMVENDNGYTDIQQATALGGITKGVKNIEMTAAYASIANYGVYIKPILYTKVLDHDGNVLIDNTPQTRAVLKESTAVILTEGMKDVVTSGTGTRARISNMAVSGKTGTTSDNVDIWMSGYTPFLTASVWGGYDSNKPMGDTVWHLNLWRNIMSRIHSGLPYTDFTIPPSVERTKLCSVTGKPPLSSCPTTTELFSIGSFPDLKCSGNHYRAKPSTGSGSNSGNNNNNNNNNSNNNEDDYYEEEETPTEPETETPTEPEPETPTEGESGTLG